MIERKVNQIPIASTTLHHGENSLSKIKSTDSVKSGSDSPLYSKNEKQQATEAFKLLIEIRNRCRKQGLIDW
jgi:hypothetical protein